MPCKTGCYIIKFCQLTLMPIRVLSRNTWHLKRPKAMAIFLPCYLGAMDLEDSENRTWFLVSV